MTLVPFEFPFLLVNSKLVISRRSWSGTTKKFTKHRDARAE